MNTAPVIHIIWVIRVRSVIAVPHIGRLSSRCRITHGTDRHPGILPEFPLGIIGHPIDIFRQISHDVRHGFVDRSQIVLIQVFIHDRSCESMGIFMCHHIKTLDQPQRSAVQAVSGISEHLIVFHFSDAAGVFKRRTVFGTHILQNNDIRTFSIRSDPSHICIEIPCLDIVGEHVQVFLIPVIIVIAADQFQIMVLPIGCFREICDCDPAVPVAKIPFSVLITLHDGDCNRNVFSEMVRDLSCIGSGSHPFKYILFAVAAYGFLISRSPYGNTVKISSIQRNIMCNERMIHLLLCIFPGYGIPRINDPDHLICRSIFIWSDLQCLCHVDR